MPIDAEISARSSFDFNAILHAQRQCGTQATLTGYQLFSLRSKSRSCTNQCLIALRATPKFQPLCGRAQRDRALVSANHGQELKDDAHRRRNRSAVGSIATQNYARRGVGVPRQH
jgi:hypothetical protein